MKKKKFDRIDKKKLSVVHTSYIYMLCTLYILIKI